MIDPNTPVEKLRNIGPKSGELLRAIGITTYAELAEVGTLESWRRVKAIAPYRVSLNWLYAIEGALTDTHWNQLPQPVIDELRAAAAASPD